MADDVNVAARFRYLSDVFTGGPGGDRERAFATREDLTHHLLDAYAAHRGWKGVRDRIDAAYEGEGRVALEDALMSLSDNDKPDVNARAFVEAVAHTLQARDVGDPRNRKLLDAVEAGFSFSETLEGTPSRTDDDDAEATWVIGHPMRTANGHVTWRRGHVRNLPDEIAPPGEGARRDTEAREEETGPVDIPDDPEAAETPEPPEREKKPTSSAGPAKREDPSRGFKKSETPGLDPDPPRETRTYGWAPGRPAEPEAETGVFYRDVPVAERVPDAPETIRVNLYPENDAGDMSDALGLPAALPPPPKTPDFDALAGWLSGTTTGEVGYGVVSAVFEKGNPEDVMEIESRLHEDPRAALRKYKIRKPCGEGEEGASWCARLGRDLGAFRYTHEQGVEAFAAAMRRTLDALDHARAAPLRHGALLVVREPLAEAVCGLMDAEAVFLEDGPEKPEGPDQNLAGCIAPNADLTRPCALDRALYLHVSASVQLGDAMRQAITEFRCAQGVRALGEEVSPAVNARFDNDPASYLEDLVEARDSLPDPA